MNKKSAKTRFYIVLLESVLVGVFMLLISENLVNWLPVTMPVTNIFQPAIGGSCGHMLYDKNGNGYETIKSDLYSNTGTFLYPNFVTKGYLGAAPIYDVKPEALGLQQTSTGCYDFPSVIDTVIAQNGISMYPILFEAKNNSKSEWLKVGESYALVVIAKVGNSFPANLDWIPVIPLAPNELIEVKFSLDATNFEVSPPNQETRKIPMGLNMPAEQTWSIAPIDRADGTQYLIASVEGDNLFAQTGLNLDIRNILGIDPKLLSVIIPLGSVVAFLLTQTKTFTDLIQAYKKKNESQKRKHKK